MHLNRVCLQYFAYAFVYEKALCKMGAAFVDNRPKTHSCDHFGAKLAYFNRNPKELLRRFVTIVEKWIYHYTRELREGSKQWIKPGKSALKRLKTLQLAGIVATSVF